MGRPHETTIRLCFRSSIYRSKRASNSRASHAHSRSRPVQRYQVCSQIHGLLKPAIIVHDRNQKSTFWQSFRSETLTHDGANRGLLLEFIDGNNLSDLSSSIGPAERYHITSLILAAIKDFEARGYYQQDLKCANIVQRDYDKSLFV